MGNRSEDILKRKDFCQRLLDVTAKDLADLSKILFMLQKKGINDDELWGIVSEITGRKLAESELLTDLSTLSPSEIKILSEEEIVSEEKLVTMIITDSEMRKAMRRLKKEFLDIGD